VRKITGLGQNHKEQATLGSLFKSQPYGSRTRGKTAGLGGLDAFDPCRGTPAFGATLSPKRVRVEGRNPPEAVIEPGRWSEAVRFVRSASLSDPAQATSCPGALHEQHYICYENRKDLLESAIVEVQFSPIVVPARGLGDCAATLLWLRCSRCRPQAELARHAAVLRTARSALPVDQVAGVGLHQLAPTL
jgi:hypothetical protein